MIADQGKHALLREGDFLIVQRTVLEPEHQLAFKQITFYDHLSYFTVTHDVSSKRSNEEKTMGHPFRKPHRNRGGSNRHDNERGEHYEDCKTED
jgi:hypothetical protein